MYLDLVHAIRQHHVQLHPLSTVSKTHPYRLCEYDTETGEYACILYREDALNFIHSYNISGPGIETDFILWLVDSGTTSFLSNLLRHMFIQIPCHTTINGVGQAACDTCAPLVLSCISEDDINYVTIEGTHVYYMPHMKFPILSTGYLESHGYEFHLRKFKPVMIAPDRRKVPLIRDDVITFTWLAERPRARITITIQQKLAKEFDNDPDSKVRRPVKIPAMEHIDPMPLRPDNKKNIDAILDARTKLPPLNFGGAGIHSNVEVEGKKEEKARDYQQIKMTQHLL